MLFSCEKKPETGQHIKYPNGISAFTTSAYAGCLNPLCRGFPF